MRDTSCFNEAADSHPRKPPSGEPGAVAVGGFNEAADSHPRKRGSSQGPGSDYRASMRPRTLIRGNIEGLEGKRQVALLQ